MSLAERLRASLSATEGHAVPFANDMRRAVAGPGTPAAVLIAVTDRPEPGLILTQRPDTMRHHAGQVAFPGGRVDPGDADAVAAALREAEEEVELARSAVEIVGSLDPYRTITGYDIVPVLGVIAPDLPLVPHVREVADVFEVPLAHVLDTANHGTQTVMFEGSQRTYIEIMWGQRRIWGATAAMLVNLGARLKW
ncbi:CoA pyrophosphatase [Sphingomonas sp. SUN039]|uniref:CoA pyrophosphatase n=1 Tax=Sphingomonas sp. SUN039 TaxID=2937787 RepID=UPI0021647B04|nr:CoA pyrophosphatase [Sphingomonas sp. SUN039]UVO52716.1 CoA pyrophosphatase [Sphingomonas sp. SUN039]